ncbi:hypothetical protein KIPB_012725, partial [Kipferlia bialata]
RTVCAVEAEMKRAMARPRTEKKEEASHRGTYKNTYFDDQGNERGRLYVQQDDMNNLNLRKFDALKAEKRRYKGAQKAAHKAEREAQMEARAEAEAADVSRQRDEALGK